MLYLQDIILSIWKEIKLADFFHSIIHRRPISTHRTKATLPTNIKKCKNTEVKKLEN